jgi:hypothetical protein
MHPLCTLSQEEEDYRNFFSERQFKFSLSHKLRLKRFIFLMQSINNKFKSTDRYTGICYIDIIKHNKRTMQRSKLGRL